MPIAQKVQPPKACWGKRVKKKSSGPGDVDVRFARDCSVHLYSPHLPSFCEGVKNQDVIPRASWLVGLSHVLRLPSSLPPASAQSSVDLLGAGTAPALVRAAPAVRHRSSQSFRHSQAGILARLLYVNYRAFLFFKS